MRQSERIAKAIVETTLSGSSMQYREFQSDGGHDFDLTLPNGTIVPLEDTSASDEELNQQIAAIADRRKGGCFLDRQLAQHDWWIHPVPGASINKIRTCVDSYLAEIEKAGKTTFFPRRTLTAPRYSASGTTSESRPGRRYGGIHLGELVSRDRVKVLTSVPNTFRER